MRKKQTVLFVLLIASGVMLFSYPVSADQVQCDQCTEEYPCAVLFEFKNVRFDHKVFCSVNDEGRETWDSNDFDKFEMFYFESPGTATTKKEVKI